jgi:hypothetical protein
MSKNKKYNYSSPMTNGILSGFSTGLGFESAKLLLPSLFNQPKQEKDSCSFEIEQMNQCFKTSSNCEEIIKLFAKCRDNLYP